MKSVSLKIHDSTSVEQAWQDLETLGFTPLYSSEDPNGTNEIIAHVPPQFNSAVMPLPYIEEMHPINLSIIDWESQWAEHGADYHDGYVHVHLEEFGPQFENVLKLEPGAGFGDLSHPTTALVLKMMAAEVPGQHVLDVGCGSGILALAAVAMDAKTVYGIDIDPQAIEHSRKNALINQMEDQVLFGFAQDYKPREKSILVLMNMISSEQKEAWESLPQMYKIAGKCLISGILAEDREAYLKQTKQWGWTLLNEIEQGGWLGLLFVRSPPPRRTDQSCGL